MAHGTLGHLEVVTGDLLRAPLLAVAYRCWERSAILYSEYVVPVLRVPRSVPSRCRSCIICAAAAGMPEKSVMAP